VAIQSLHALFLAASVGGVALSFVRSLPWWTGPGLIVFGLLATTLTGAIASAVARRAGRAVGQVAVGQLSVELSAVAQDTLFDPITKELTRYHATLADFAHL
jgi:hypothetical protein